MKTQQQSVPPAPTGGLTQPTTNAQSPAHASAGDVPNDNHQPPATAGGSDTTDDAALAQLQAENEQLRATIRLDAAHRQITGELAEAGARSPELLFDTVRGDLQFAEDGTLENAAAVLDKLKASFPEQFGPDRPPSIDGGSGQTALPRLTREALHRMSAAEIAELDWNDVKRVLSAS